MTVKDYLVKNVRIVDPTSVLPPDREPQDVLCRYGKIAAIGRDLSAYGATVCDADGSWLLPGLWDQHVHMTQWAISSRRLDVSAAQSAAEAASLCAQALVAGETLIAQGYHNATWPDQISAELLDQKVGDHPVVLISGDLHGAWANSAALNKFQLGNIGHPLGALQEEDAFELQRRISDLDEDLIDSWVQEAACHAQSRGVVGIVDMEMTWNFDPWRRRMGQGFDQLRVRASIYPQWLDQAIALDLHSGDIDQEFELLEVGPLKIITDGSLNTQTAYCQREYPGSTHRGVMPIAADELVQLLRKAKAQRLWCAVHAIGDAANSIVLDCFEQTLALGRIEHAQLVSDADLDRFADLGVSASVQPQHLIDDCDVADQIWKGWTNRTYRFADLRRHGARLVFGSDAPVAKLDPWHQIQAAVERCLPDGCAWHPEQALTHHDCLAASVEHGITLGAPADLVIVENDPLQSSGNQLREMPVAMTFINGRMCYHNGAICSCEPPEAPAPFQK